MLHGRRLEARERRLDCYMGADKNMGGGSSKSASSAPSEKVPDSARNQILNWKHSLPSNYRESYAIGAGDNRIIGYVFDMPELNGMSKSLAKWYSDGKINGDVIDTDKIVKYLNNIGLQAFDIFDGGEPDINGTIYGGGRRRRRRNKKGGKKTTLKRRSRR